MDKTSYPYWRSCLDEIYVETLHMIHPGKDIEQAAKEAYGHLLADELRLKNAQPSDFKRLVNGWLSTKSFPKTRNTNRLDLTKI